MNAITWKVIIRRRKAGGAWERETLVDAAHADMLAACLRQRFGDKWEFRVVDDRNIPAASPLMNYARCWNNHAPNG